MITIIIITVIAIATIFSRINFHCSEHLQHHCHHYCHDIIVFILITGNFCGLGCVIVISVCAQPGGAFSFGESCS